MSTLSQDFGVVVACHAGDYPLALGCVASVRHFMQDVPIALIADGDFDVALTERRFGVQVIRRGDVRNPFLKDNSFGWGLTKMVAFWECPWEWFLYVDADTILWGDVRPRANFAMADVTVDLPRQVYSDGEVNTFFFATNQLQQAFPGFKWRGRPFVNSGTFFARRGAIRLSDYQRLIEFNQATPGLFQCGEQGILNMLLFQAAEENRIRLAQIPLQTLVPDYPVSELHRQFQIEGNAPAVGGTDARVIHWCGEKPWIVGGATFRAPMTFFRRRTFSWGKLWLGDALRMVNRGRWGRGMKRRWSCIPR